MTNKACFVLQIASAVLLILAMIFYMVYCAGVIIPEMSEDAFKDPDKSTGMSGMITGWAVFMGASAYFTLGVVGVLAGVFVLVISIMMNKSKPRKFGLIALHSIAQVLLIVVTSIYLPIRSEGNAFLVVAIACCVSCVLWAVQFFAIASHINVGKQINTPD